MNCLPKESKIFSVHVQEKSCNSPEGQQLYQKDNSAQVFFCEYFLWPLCNQWYKVYKYLSMSHDQKLIKKPQPPEVEYQMEPFKWGLPAAQIWMFLAS